MKRCHDEHIEAGHTDTWAIQRYRDRISPKGTKKANQQCGYCGEYGHTRRKCEVLQKDMNWYVVHHNILVKVAHDYIVTSPVGIGSLFTSTVRRWINGEPVQVTEHLVLTDFEIPLDIKKGQFAIYAILKSIQQGTKDKWNVREWVKNPTFQDRWSAAPKLVAPHTGIVPSSWVADNSIDIAEAKQLGFFRRVGRNSEDKRNHQLARRDQAKRYLESAEVDTGSWRYKNYTEELESFEPKNIRAKMFKDFKSGE
tara:strand:- start:686 stop:1447 length:762 start_codon:yes stop_codon:yes gene_type:complete